MVALLVAGAVASATPALGDDDRGPRTRSVITALADPGHPTHAPEPVATGANAELHGVLRSTKLPVVDVCAAAAGLAVSRAAAVPGVVGNSLLLVAAGVGPLVSARHLRGHLRT